MAKVHTLTVELRNTQGKRANRRLRNSGSVPAVLYGHKQEVKNITLQAEQIGEVVRHGNRFVVLTGGIAEKAFIKDVQWNTWGTDILHVDFARVSEHEKVRVTVAVELRGEAPGTKDGGVIKHVTHSIELECEAASVPEKIDVNINHLEFNQTIHAGDLELPQGVRALIDPVIVIVSCAAPVEISEEESAAGEAEPEVIGRKKTEEEPPAAAAKK
ncbi:MAG: 50S ribosomal protein L25 [Planctomycetaceae bacterium]|jgi:large subunit ribosomal protein L25|nr:50S ribosomal protein L25 [Planctomycetaceae bacterium]